MPISEEKKKLYPKNWRQISLRIRTRAKWRCQFCGVKYGIPGFRDWRGRFIPWVGRPNLEGVRHFRIILTVAHLNHDPRDCRDENLRALCQRCHLRYDARHHAANAKATREKKIRRATRGPRI